MKTAVQNGNISTERSAPSLFSIIYNGIGIALGIFLFLFGGNRFLTMLDRFLASDRGEAQVKVVKLDLDQSEEDDHFYVQFKILKTSAKAENFIVTIDNKRLFEELKENSNRREPLSARLAFLPISRRYTLSRVEKIPVLKKPKIQGLIIFLGLTILGGAIVFTSVREIKRGFKRRV